MIGFFICLGLSILFFFMTIGSIGGIFVGSITSFAVFYLLATITSITASFFLKGPKAQWKAMKDPQRLLPTIVMIISFVCAWLFLYVWESNILVIICVSVHICASSIYVMTYIPGGKKCCLKCCKACCTSCCGNDEENKEPIL